MLSAAAAVLNEVISHSIMTKQNCDEAFKKKRIKHAARNA